MRKCNLVFMVMAVVLFPAAVGSAVSHQDIWLKNELGDRITPQENRADPYSPKKTCGACHGYATITRGYHFQQGFDAMSDRYDAKRPWLLSPGMYGNWLPYAAAGQLAAKKNNDPLRMDLSAYDWIGGGKLDTARKIESPACGWCHPGGGPMEYGRNAAGRADLSRTLAQAESGKADPLDGDFSSRFTPDGRSHFRESGVVEADCLICHLPGYRMEERNTQLTVRNYRWAATAGAGLGSIEGAVFTFTDPTAGPEDPRYLSGRWNLAKRPAVTYRWTDRNLFAADGRLKGALVSKAVGAKNCLQCHGPADAKNTGTINTAPHDAHARAGFTCTDCHPLVGKTPGGRLEHQIAKGAYPQTNVRDDLDGVDFKTCIGCHKEGRYRATRAGMPKTARNPETAHAEKFPQALFHTALVTCNGCHATAQPARGMALLDLGAGEERGYTADGYQTVLRPDDYGTAVPTPWPPWITRTGGGPGGGYLAHVPKRIQWFGEKTVGGIRPIPLHQVKKAIGTLKRTAVVPAVRTDGEKMNVPSVLTDEEIARMITALGAAGFKNVVFLADRLYELSGGRLVAGANALPADSYPIAHGVVPLERTKAYGAKGRWVGCFDCHGQTSPFFNKAQIMDMREFLRHYPDLKAPQALPQMNGWGMTRVPPPL